MITSLASCECFSLSFPPISKWPFLSFTFESFLLSLELCPSSFATAISAEFKGCKGSTLRPSAKPTSSPLTVAFVEVFSGNFIWVSIGVDSAVLFVAVSVVVVDSVEVILGKMLWLVVVMRCKLLRKILNFIEYLKFTFMSLKYD